MDSSKKDIVYQMVINNITLNTFNFNIRMIGRDDINEMLQIGMIQACGNNMYEFLDVKGLYNYGVRLFSIRKNHEAIDCFTKCYEMDNSDRNIILQYFWVTLKKHDYLETMRVYEEMLSFVDIEDCKNNNLYLYLLSVIVPNLEEKYASEVKSFKYSDMFLPTTGYNYLNNTIRNAILRGKYPYASKLLNEKSRLSIEYVLCDEVLRILLSQTIDEERKFKKAVFSFIADEDYDSLINLLKSRESQRNLNRMESSILIIAENIKSILTNGFVDFIIDEDNSVDNIYNAILINDYKKALELNGEFLERNGENPNVDVLNILLLRIIELINKYDYYDVNSKCDDFNDGVSVCQVETACVVDEEVIDITLDKRDEHVVFEYKDDFEKVIFEAEEWAYYIKSLNVDVNGHIKKVGLLPRYALLVKLIYARDYYISGNNDMGDKLVMEVENSFIRDSMVEKFIKVVKEYKCCKKGKGYTKKR